MPAQSKFAKACASAPPARAPPAPRKHSKRKAVSPDPSNGDDGSDSSFGTSGNGSLKRGRPGARRCELCGETSDDPRVNRPTPFSHIIDDPTCIYALAQPSCEVQRYLWESR